jgi:NAD(P)-dependent dehydrogenase (short-subunit alcohol dehydrogenase family)
MPRMAKAFVSSPERGHSLPDQAQGMGFAPAKGLAEAGAEIVLHGRDRDSFKCAAVFPASKASTFVNGQIIYADGGLTGFV